MKNVLLSKSCLLLSLALLSSPIESLCQGAPMFGSGLKGSVSWQGKLSTLSNSSNKDVDDAPTLLQAASRIMRDAVIKGQSNSPYGDKKYPSHPLFTDSEYSQLLDKQIFPSPSKVHTQAGTLAGTAVLNQGDQKGGAVVTAYRMSGHRANAMVALNPSTIQTVGTTGIDQKTGVGGTTSGAALLNPCILTQGLKFETVVAIGPIPPTLHHRLIDALVRILKDYRDGCADQKAAFNAIIGITSKDVKIDRVDDKSLAVYADRVISILIANNNSLVQSANARVSDLSPKTRADALDTTKATGNEQVKALEKAKVDANDAVKSVLDADPPNTDDSASTDVRAVTSIYLRCGFSSLTFAGKNVDTTATDKTMSFSGSVLSPGMGFQILWGDYHNEQKFHIGIELGLTGRLLLGEITGAGNASPAPAKDSFLNSILGGKTFFTPEITLFANYGNWHPFVRWTNFGGKLSGFSGGQLVFGSDLFVAKF